VRYRKERAHTVAQLVEALRYKPEERGFDSRWCHWNFSLTLTFRPHYGPGVISTANRNEYQEYFLGNKGGRSARLTSPPSCADCLEIWEPQPSGTHWACPGPHRDCFTVQFKNAVWAETHKYRSTTLRPSVPPLHCKQYTLCQHCIKPENCTILKSETNG
jgi:hypothetical protein